MAVERVLSSEGAFVGFGETITLPIEDFDETLTLLCRLYVQHVNKTGHIHLFNSDNVVFAYFYTGTFAKQLGLGGRLNTGTKFVFIEGLLSGRWLNCGICLHNNSPNASLYDEWGKGPVTLRWFSSTWVWDLLPSTLTINPKCMIERLLIYNREVSSDEWNQIKNSHWTNIPEDGLITDLSFDTGRGVKVLDKSGKGYNAKLNKANWRTKWMKGISFDGVSKYVTAPNLKLDKFSATFWIKTDEKRSWKYPLSNEGAQTFSSGVHGWRFSLGINGRYSNFDLSEGPENWSRINGGTINDDRWHLITLWWDGKNQRIYVDCELKDEAEFTGDILNDLPVTIGSRYGPGNFCKCTIGSLRIDTPPLEEEYLEKIFLNPDINVSPETCILKYDFRNYSGSVVLDRSGNGNHGIIHADWTVKIAQGMHFYNGGIYFDSNIDLDCNYATTVAVFSIDTLHRGGKVPMGRNCVLRVGGDKLMLYNDNLFNMIQTTNFDGQWKSVGIVIDSKTVYTAAGVQNNNEEHIITACNGYIIDHRFRTDIGDAGYYNKADVQIGSNTVGNYPLQGDVLAAFIYDRPISEEEVKQISMYYYDKTKIPQNGLVFGCILNRFIYGDTPYDFVNDVYASYIGNPFWNVR